MAIAISYKRLFEVECWHEYHLNTPEQAFGTLDAAVQREVMTQKRFDIGKDIEFVPTEETLQRLAGEGLLFKTLPTGFFVAIRAEKQANGSYSPRSMPTEGLRLTFCLNVRNSRFFNYTNLPLHDTGGKVYYFGNRTAGSVAWPEGSALYLSSQISSYRDQPYRAGDLVQEGDQIYESLMDQPVSEPPSGSTLWNALLGAVGYIHGGDQVLRLGSVSSYVFPSGKAVNASFALRDLDQATRTVRLMPEAGNSYSLTETDARGTLFPITTVAAEAGNALESVRLDLRTVPAGRYDLQVAGERENGDAFEEIVPIYLMHETRPVWAVLEVVYRSGDQSGPYKMIDTAAGNSLLLPRYVLHFHNRSTYWRYRFGQEPTKKPNESELVEENGAYVTHRPQPLITSYRQVTYNGTPLPNPSVGTIKPEQSKIYSDIYL